ncbi:MAG: hypothetical protein WCO56_15905 [Verrucomicrobiota bacterium]
MLGRHHALASGHGGRVRLLLRLLLAGGLAAALVPKAPAQVTISFGYAPTGIAYLTNGLIAVTSSIGVSLYDTNGTSVGSFSAGSGIVDAGAGVNGGVNVLGSGVTHFDKDGNGIGIINSTGPSPVVLGAVLTLGGVNYQLLGANGTVYAQNVATSALTPIMSLSNVVGVTGGDWVLRPGGTNLDQVLLGFCTPTSFRSYYPDGTLHTLFALNGNGTGQDMAFGVGCIYAAQKVGTSGGAVIEYPFTVPPIPVASRMASGAVGRGITLSVTNQSDVVWTVQSAPSPTGAWTNEPAITWATNGNRITTTLTNAAPRCFYRLTAR